MDSLCYRPCFESLGSVRQKMVETRGLQGLLASQGQEWLEFRGKVHEIEKHRDATEGEYVMVVMGH